MSQEQDALTTEVLQRLRRKEGTWQDWGAGCQQLQKQGLSPQAIFEATGIEPIHQNQLIIALQVSQSLREAPEAVRAYFQTRGSDLLYELRVLSGSDRLAAATLIVEKQLDVTAVHEVCRALKAVSYQKDESAGFGESVGDRIGRYYWQLARQQRDLAQRSRLIAQGFRFVESATGRQALEKLLTDFTVVPAASQPRLPLYRLDSAEDLPYLVPVAGTAPLAAAAFNQVPQLTSTGALQLVAVPQPMTLVALPSWQVLLNAVDPVAVLWPVADLPAELPPTPEGLPIEQVLLIVDRGLPEWDRDRYLLIAPAASDPVQLAWFPEPPTAPILGQLLLVLRPPQVLDESINKELWFFEE
ncbi:MULTISPECIES: RuBisCO accumulation factor 1 [unclassified Thermosynechococcus]|uniref:RuBisCO accumulation factor 1 n=1 Tax=unclassified Thermosynechococcus TaxID=2622553 RepID=UPI00285A78F4|nr:MULTISPECIES: RuBisCO accumulation factor 1 [unclassified Thermosynechococcus]MDR7922316.1 RuBisCO accumulation factor 1 [Thermosynechococcus sp. HY213]WNC32219.1 RuBisCO accumulation factor 1 [Thermosynechococcus sp. PKX95]WNC34747.1 RuBisCO accumulation factor 1 [Thermosynechococcus sp. PKX91]WNC37264.1 RuBisCO accumulation factor 1 [Thermosynechococcus sp. WL11]WNC39786.1 RuBisCO accumulation factor 1 [Thermosynechococcus sp. WL17]